MNDNANLMGGVREDDRRDLLTLLAMRFGPPPRWITDAVETISDLNRLDHLILVAANATRWATVEDELQQPGFRIVGADFDPLGPERSTEPKKETADDREA